MQSLLPHLCKIQTRSNTPDALGSPVYAYADTYTDVKCRLTRMSGKKAREDYGEFTGELNVLILEADATITEENRVVQTGGTGYTYDVLKVIPRYDDANLHHYEVDIMREA